MSINSSANKTEQLVKTALMMSLILIGTLLLRIPIPMTQGYVHLGDAMIYIGVLTLGKKHGTAAAALGSAMADVLGGYAVWAPWTLVIKAAMAYIAGAFAEKASAGASRPAGQTDDIRSEVRAESERTDGRGASRKRAVTAAGMVLGGLLMTAGYYIAEGIMYGNWPAAALGIPWNIGQFTAGIAVSTAVSAAVTGIRAR